MKTEKCPTCGRTLPLPEWRECSHVDCPARKPITAAPPAGKAPTEPDNTHG